MKPFRPSPIVALAWLAALLLCGCGGPSEYAIVGTARAAGADGTVELGEVEGGTRLVTVSMKHLPPPQRLGDGLRTYVVWFVPKDRKPVNAGRLDYDADSRKGRMMATSPLESFDVRITAEKKKSVAAPSDVVVAQRKISGSN